MNNMEESARVSGVRMRTVETRAHSVGPSGRGRRFAGRTVDCVSPPAGPLDINMAELMNEPHRYFDEALQDGRARTAASLCARASWSSVEGPHRIIRRVDVIMTPGRKNARLLGAERLIQSAGATALNQPDDYAGQRRRQLSRALEALESDAEAAKRTAF